MRYNVSMQTITAYRYRIIDAKSRQPMPSGDGTDGTIDIVALLDEFAVYMEKTKISPTTQKALSLIKTANTQSSVAKACVHFKATAGKYGQRTVAVNINDERRKTELGTDNAICHFYNVFFYVENTTGDNICIFHRYGRGGCKTVFLELFNRFLSAKGMRVEMYALVSPEQESILKTGRKTKLRLLKNSSKAPHSSDIADNMRPPKRMSNNTEMELTINLRNRKIASKAASINDVIFGNKTVAEVFEIPDDFEYDQAKLEMYIGNQQRTVDLDNIGALLCELDITHKLSYDVDNEPTYASISDQADSYYSIQKKKALL